MDTDTNKNVADANVSYSWVGGSGKMVYSGGWYIVDIDSSKAPNIGTYNVTVVALKNGYEKSSTTVRVEVQDRTKLIADKEKLNTIVGSPFTIKIYYNDTWHNTPILGANITYSWEFRNGTYMVTLKASVAREKPYDIVIVAQKSSYETSTITISVVSKTSAAVLSLKALAVGSGSAVIVISGFASWYFYFRFPPFVRLIKGILTCLERGGRLKLGKVRDRKKIISDLIREDYRFLSEQISLPSGEEELRIEVLEEEMDDELVEAEGKTLKDTSETVEKLTGVKFPEKLSEEIKKKED